ncbi:branched-chain amino acid ABC transporter permease [Cellulomonas dongxiuzhuiae]|uniref:Branched-chain amino acid ABC transporter permease n=1 Tax=Cellulomonas dongxiuzhuiae TaxID=2819979 RepID=A0ABX8GPM2_9CELL|nr:branched-chain amino acid ABC transporter permease [Cellulomonas dongxiuzhuiae]MBO3093565.1 branched-chain amino acid ABC transporter permease [Cellulomonas dongxiuzhuiae]QWC17870.1 branched-chain amino acid ABC transporter permease [Cellulomonas dongxiuzhuiae]
MLLVLLTALSTLLVGGSARAATTPCSPDDATACLNVTVTVPGTGPAAGVALNVEGADGAVDVVTDAAGKISVPLTTAGDYTVTVDETTLPAGTVLKDPAANPVVVAVVLGRSAGRIVQAVPPDQAGAAAEETEEASPTTGADAGSGADTEAGAEAEASAEASAGPGTNRYAQLVLAGTVFGVLLALAALGANLIYGTTGLSNFAHGELVTLGGMTAFMAVQWWDLPLWLAIVVSTAAGGLMGWLLNRVVFGPLRRRGVGITQQMIVTIGLSLAMLSGFLFVFGARPAPIVSGISQRMQIGPVQISGQSLVSVGIALVVLAVVAFVLARTRLGRATRAVSDNPALAAATGIKVESVISRVWIVSAALASLGGVLLALYLNTTRFNFGSTLLLLMFAAITLGGLGSPLGAVLGALVIGLVVELSTLVLPSDMRYASALVILILVLLLRPQGILGRAERIG